MGMEHEREDTIAAISTSLAEAGIAIVRMSGPNAFCIIEAILKPHNKKRFSEGKSHTVHYGSIMDQESIVDEVLILLMRRPKTYTKEDMVEIQCHGGNISARLILNLLQKKGARIAAPGEFTKRAFLNGRIDLAQAEAVMDIISSQSELAHRQAMRHLEGGLSREMNEITDGLVAVSAEMEAFIDFPEEELPLPHIRDWQKTLDALSMRMAVLLDSASWGRIIKEGIKVCICGIPNVGKSSLLNAILKEERMIVSDIPGTTRDSVDESVNIGGLKVRLYDTAGMMSTAKGLDQKAGQKARAIAEDADLLLWVVDGSRTLSEDEKSLMDWLRTKRTIVVINKIDQTKTIDTMYLTQIFGEHNVVEVSALKGKNIHAIEEKIHGQSERMHTPSALHEIYVTSARHRDIIEQAKESIAQACISLNTHMPLECAASDLKEALHRLGTITGRYVTDDILHVIFERFCIGK